MVRRNASTRMDSPARVSPRPLAELFPPLPPDSLEALQYKHGMEKLEDEDRARMWGVEATHMSASVELHVGTLAVEKAVLMPSQIIMPGIGW